MFVDAPHVLQPVDLVGSTALESLGGTEIADVNKDPLLTPRAWWKSNPERTKAHGLAESLAFIKEVLRGRTFDGVLGFSQGAAFAAIIAALLERPHLYPQFLVDGKPVHPPLQFCVSVSGFKLRDPISEPFFDPFYETPTLHVIGKTDIIVVEERSMLLVEASGNARVEEHEGGHFVPSKGQWRKFIRDYMMDPFADIPSPGLASSSVPNSGRVSPINGSAMMIKL